ncbi:MAG TPA: LPXTG cell wall anchor domain-containing protein [Rhizorhapis sp.]|uniref:LPXTG cell wall anchor domain-containing protein n=1 Tax=Rhizorhapis sp. TaxID=1968842 RepID=UPI002B4A886B|nr:LPXTG cell wall anchor domain-containing protein [Rhizorhapis sp.]HKR16253.1 LPXTG cell wall anchor domain-containing protein [Rhizorhapis sp.]HKX22130.1 LPXTG cell wall anchor domain-containing protein [Rhizorhapis sp.]HKX36435.1 LPXTG cell wall anchor domain-containing protein [Rhizorhapis sp.]
MSDLVLSIIMLAGLMLLGGGLWMIFKRRDQKRGLLMLIAALVMFANVAVWLVPVKGG